jgi:hypothetical protein
MRQLLMDFPLLFITRRQVLTDPEEINDSDMPLRIMSGLKK